MHQGKAKKNVKKLKENSVKRNVEKSRSFIRTSGIETIVIWPLELFSTFIFYTFYQMVSILV